MGIELRKHQDTLRIAGTGVAAFGTWSVVRSVVYFVTGVREIQSSFPGRVADHMTATVLYVLLFTLLSFDLGLRFYVGLCARAEAKGRREGVMYLVVTGILIASYVYSIPQDVIVFMRGRNGVLDTVASLLIDLTSLITLAMLLASALRVKRLYRAAEEREDGV